MMFDLTGRTALVTGATGGIGGAIAQALHAQGATVAISGTRREALDALAGKLGERVHVLPCNLSEAAEVEALVPSAEKAMGQVDILIANAGIGTTTDAAELDAAEVARIFGVNVIGAASSVAAVVPEMVKRGSGQLVAISSIAAYRGLPKSASYGASKAALSSFFESLRLDLQPKGIEVTIIHPGFIKTPLTAGRKAQMPYLMELDYAVKKIIHAIEKKRKSYAFPWQLASIVRLGMLMPNALYDRLASRRSYRE